MIFSNKQLVLKNVSCNTSNWEGNTEKNLKLLNLNVKEWL